MIENNNIEFLPNYLPFYILKANNDILDDIYKYFYNVSSKKNDNHNSNLKKGDYLLIKNKQDQIYIVKPVDTFEKIAKEFNVSVDIIKNKNNIQNLFIGQQLII